MWAETYFYNGLAWWLHWSMIQKKWYTFLFIKTTTLTCKMSEIFQTGESVHTIWTWSWSKLSSKITRIIKLTKTNFDFYVSLLDLSCSRNATETSVNLFLL